MGAHQILRELKAVTNIEIQLFKMLPMDCLLMDHSTLVVYLQPRIVIAKKISSCSVEALDFRKDLHDSDGGWGHISHSPLY